MMIEKPKIQERREKLTKHQCVECKEIFKDFNKHFQHLQKTGHAKGWLSITCVLAESPTYKIIMAAR